MNCLALVVYASCMSLCKSTHPVVSSALTSAGRAWRTPMASPTKPSVARRAQVEALRPLGLRLLRGVLRRFGAAPDPLAEGGGLLLAQLQAQFVAALRGALAPGSAPVAAAAGAGLAAAFLAAGLAGGDAAVLARLHGLLCAPLAAWDAPREEARLPQIEQRCRAGAACSGKGQVHGMACARLSHGMGSARL